MDIFYAVHTIFEYNSVDYNKYKFLNLNILIIKLHSNALNTLVIKINWLTMLTNLGYFVTHFVAIKQKFFSIFLFADQFGKSQGP